MNIIQPFLRWPGGKRWLLPHLLPIINRYTIKRYCEPFLGGGAVFFAIHPQHAIISDSNSNLINAYIEVKYRPDQIIQIIQSLAPTKETYYQIRSCKVECPSLQAAHFIYLNRMAFSGMYRVNKWGEFNVPFGGDRRLDTLWKQELIKQASVALKRTKIIKSDFEDSIQNARPGDLFYCDPTYTVAHNDNGFLRYNENIFSWDDQIRLANACISAAERGAIVLISNAATKEIAKLYRPYKPIIINRFSSISPKIGGRKNVQEFLFVITQSK